MPLIWYVVNVKGFFSEKKYSTNPSNTSDLLRGKYVLCFEIMIRVDPKFSTLPQGNLKGVKNSDDKVATSLKPSKWVPM